MVSLNRKRGDEIMANVEKRLLSRKEACNYVGLGLSRGVEFCDQAGARVQYGKRVMYDKQKLDKYIDAQTKNK